MESPTCLRCSTAMMYMGRKTYREGTILVTLESFDVYHCPSCGKVEFFVPSGLPEQPPDSGDSAERVRVRQKMAKYEADYRRQK